MIKSLVSRLPGAGALKLAGGAFAAGAAVTALTVAAPLWATLRAELADHRTTREAAAEVRADLDAERKARQGQADQLIAARQREAEATAERDKARSEAAAARARIVTRTVEIIRETDPVWSAVPVPDRVRDARLRGWCARRPGRADHPVCRDTPDDERGAGG